MKGYLAIFPCFPFLRLLVRVEHSHCLLLLLLLLVRLLLDIGVSSSVSVVIDSDIVDVLPANADDADIKATKTSRVAAMG